MDADIQRFLTTEGSSGLRDLSSWRGRCLSRLFDEAAEAIELRVGAEGKLLWMCENLRRRLGAGGAAARELRLPDLLHPGSAQWVMEAGHEVGPSMVLQLKDAAGSPFSVRAVAVRRADEVHVMGVLTTDCDLAEQRQLHAVNNELAVTSRELARQRRELESLVAQARAREAELRTAYSTIERIARTDPLTGLFNRRVLEDELPHQLEQARTARRPLSVLVVDLDHFKQINDSFGHEAGDQVLARVAGVLRQGVRADDLAVRLGGEELMVVLPGASADRALEVAHDLRAAIEATDFGALGPVVTASIGVATTAGEGDTLPGLLARADTAMYRAKALGRNRCELAEPTDGQTGSA